jgi:hypothetical protein
LPPSSYKLINTQYEYFSLDKFRGARLFQQRLDERGFYRNRNRGERNEWVVTSDEALIVTKGALTVRSSDGDQTARP